MSEYSKENLLIRPGAGEKSGSHLFVKVHASQLNNEYSVMEGTMEPGSLLAPHTHQREDQVVVILTSELEFQVGGEGGERFTAPAGSYVIKPRAIEHTFWNATNEPSRYIELSG
ncbi:MAG: cupin domain-containing protein, partial [Myxococcota bacterium]